MSDNNRGGEEVEKRIGPYVISIILSKCRKNIGAGNFWKG